MSKDVNVAAGGRLEVAFSFYTGPAGVSPSNEAGEAIVAIRRPSPPRSWEKGGTIEGQPVEVVDVGRSPVEGYMRATVRLVAASEAPASAQSTDAWIASAGAATDSPPFGANL